MVQPCGAAQPVLAVWLLFLILAYFTAPSSAGDVSATASSSSVASSAGSWYEGPCPPGYGRANEYSWYCPRQCNICPRNTYSTGDGITCTPCPLGSYTTTSGCTSEAQCTCYSGYRKVAGSCQLICPANHYLETSLFTTTGTCYPCPAGSISPAGSIGSTACRATPSPAPNAAVTTCKPGWGKLTSGSRGGRCVQCPRGHFSPGGVTATCQKCPAFSTNDKAGSTTCACQRGRGGPSCLLCPAGTYSPGGSFASCIPCGLLMTSPKRSPSIEYCQCVAGFGSTTARPTDCLPCPIGTYQPDPTQDARRPASSGMDAARTTGKPNTLPCTRCPTGRSTILTQATMATDCKADCPRGFGTQPPNYDKCVAAPIGFWASGGPIGNVTTQTAQCPIGTTTLKTRSSAESQCIRRRTSSTVGLKAQDDSYTYTLPTLTIPAARGVLVNDNYTGSCEAGTGTATLLAVSTRGSVSLDTDGGFVYTVTNSTPLGASGDDSFTYTITDCKGATDVAKVRLVFVRPPTANSDTYNWTGRTVSQPTPGVLANDVHVGCFRERVSVSVVAEAKWGIVELNFDGAFVYLAKANPSQSDAFTYELKDCNGNTARAAVTLNFQASPSAKDDVYEWNGEPFSKTATVGVLANDVTIAAPLSAALQNQAMNGFVSLSKDGAFTYSPSDTLRKAIAANKTRSTRNLQQTQEPGNLNDMFTYVVTDANGWSARAQVFLRYVPNPMPVAADDMFNFTNTGTSQPLGAILKNDQNPGCVGTRNTSLVVSLATGPSKGVLTLAQDGRFTYTSNNNPPASDSFTYRVTDCNGNSATARVMLEYQPPPTARDDTRPYTGEGFSAAAPGVLSNDLIAPYCSPGATRAALVTQARNGVATVSPDGSYVYVPSRTPGTSDSFVYSVTDCAGNTATATVTLPYVAPVKANDDVYVHYGMTYKRLAAAGVLANDVNPPGCPANSLNASQILASGPKNGYLVLNPDGSFIYTPAVKGADDAFTYTATDCNGYTSQAEVKLVFSPNDPTAAVPVNDRYTFSGTSLSVTAEKGVMANDIKANCSSTGGLHSTSLASSGSKGTVALASDGSFVYIATSTPGSDTFVYKLTDCNNNVKTATVQIVYIVPPVANDDKWTYTGNKLALAAPGLLANDKVEGCPTGTITLSAPTKTQAGVLAVDPQDGSFSYLSSTTPSQTDTFTYSLTDCNGNTDSALVTLTYVAPPTAKDDTYEFTGGQVLKLATNGVLANDINAASCLLTGPLTAAIVTKPVNGALALDKDGSFVYTPAGGVATQGDTFTYAVTDCNGNNASATVTLKYVQPTAPNAADDSFTFTGTNGAASITRSAGALLANDQYTTVCPGPSNKTVVTLVTSPVTGQLSVGEDGGFTYTVASVAGSAAIKSVSFVYRLADCNGQTDTAKVELTYVQPPIAVDDRVPYQGTSLFRPASVGVLANDQNTPACPNTPITASIVTPSRNTLTLNPDGSFNYLVLTTGDDSFVYKVTDCNGNTATATVELPYVAGSIATDDTFKYVGGSVTKLAGQGVLTNDVAAPSCQSGSLTATLVTGPTSGVLKGGLSKDGAFVYEPYSIPASTDDQFSYRITDCNGNTATAVARIAFSPSDPSSLLAADDKYSFSGPVTIDRARGVLANDRNAAACSSTALVPTVVAAATKGTVSLSADGSFSYTPSATPGNDEFTYEVKDCTGITDRAVVTLTYLKPPEASNDVFKYTVSPATISAPGVLANDNYLANCAVRVSPSSFTTSLGTFTLAPDGGLTYASASGRAVTDTFTYTVTDCNNNADTATVTLQMVEVPTALADTYTYPGRSFTVAAGTNGVLLNDVNPACPGKVLTAAVANPTIKGTVTMTTDGGFTYQPNAGLASGDDSFTYKVTDCNGNAATGAVSLKYEAPATATADTYMYSASPLQINAAQGVLANDRNAPTCAAQSKALAIAVVTSTSKGTLQLNPSTGEFTYTASAAQATLPDETFTYSTTDCFGNVATAKVDIQYELSGVAKDDIYYFSSSPVSISAAQGLLLNDVNSPTCTSQSIPLVASRVTSTTGGIVTVNSGGDFVYTVDGGLASPQDDSYTYQVRDCNGKTSTARVTLKYELPLVVKDDTYTYSSNTVTIAAAAGLLLNDVNPPSCVAQGRPLTAVRVSAPNSGTVTVNSAGDFTYVSTTATLQDDSFTYQATDCRGNNRTGRVTLKYQIPAKAVDDTIYYSQSPVQINALDGLLENDINPDGCVAQGIALVVTRLTAATSGIAAVNSAGDLTYTTTTPATDKFTYKVTDCNGQSSTATVNLVYELAVVVKDDTYTYYTSPFQISAALGLLANDVNPQSCIAQGIALVASRVTAAANGNAVVSSAGDFSYTNTSALPQEDSFTYQATDCRGNVRTGRVNLRYQPAARAFDDTIVYSQSPLQVNALDGLLKNDFNPPACVAQNAPLSVARVTAAGSGVATVNAAGDLTYTVTAAPPKDDLFQYRVTDCNGQTSTATVNLKFEQPIVATADTFIYYTSPYTVAAVDGVLKNDVSSPKCAGTAPAVTIVSQAKSGEVRFGAGGGFTYSSTSATPVADQFTYRVTDCNGQSSTAVVDLVFEQPIVATADTFFYSASPFAVAAASGLLNNDNNAPGCVGKVPTTTMAVQAKNGDITIVAGGGFTYTSTSTPLVNDQFTYRVTDCHGQSSTAVVDLVFVQSVVAKPDTYFYATSPLTLSAADGVVLNDNVPAGCTAPTFSVITQAASGTVLISAGGAFTYTSTSSTPQTDKFTYNITCNGRSSTAQVDLVFQQPIIAKPDTFTYYTTPVTINAADGLLKNDANPPACAASPPTFSVVTPPAKGTLSLIAGGGFTYASTTATPGNDQFTYRATDCNGWSSTAMAELVFEQPIVANNDRFVYSESPYTVAATSGVVLNDVNPPSCAAVAPTFTIASQAKSGNVAIVAGGSFTYTSTSTPLVNDQFTYRVTDCHGQSSTAVVDLVFVQSVVAKPDTFRYATLPLTIPATSGVVVNDDVPTACSAPTFSIATPAASGTVVISAGGAFTYTSTSSTPQTDKFTYNITCNGRSSTAQVDLVFQQPIVAKPDTFTYYTTPVTVNAADGLLKNDANPPACAASPPTYSLVSSPTKGTVTLGADGAFTYTSSSATPANDQFTYRATDCNGWSSTAIAELLFEQPIVANSDRFTYSESPLTIAAASGVLVNDVNPPSCAAVPPTFTVATQAKSGNVVIVSGGGFTYTSTSTPLVNDQFTYRVTDCHGQSSTAVVDLVFVQSVVAKPDSYFYSTSPLAITAASGVVLNDDVPASCTAPTFSIATPAASGTAVISGGGAFTYTSTSSTPQTDKFTYNITCNGRSSTAQVDLVFQQPIVAKPDTFTYYTTPVTVNAADGLLKNDANPPACAASPPTFSVVTPPTGGTVTLGAGGAFTYSSTSATPGNDQFTYRATDCNGWSSTAVAELVFEQPIVANNDRFVYSESPYTVAATSGVVLNDVNPPSCAAVPPTFTVAAQAKSGNVDIVSGGGLTYTSTSTPLVNDQFTYRVTDCHGQSSTAVVDLVFVQSVVAKPDSYFYSTSPLAITAASGVVLNDDVPASCTAPAFSIATPAASGTILISAGGAFTYTSTSSTPQTDKFTYNITCNGRSSTAQVDLVFQQPIVAEPDTFTYYTTPVTVNAADGLLKNDANPPACAASPPTFSVVTPPTGGTVTIGAGGAFTYTATSATPGNDQFTYKVTDCNSQSSTATAQLQYKQPIVATSDAYTYSVSPYSVAAGLGVLRNDALAPSCAGQQPTLTVQTPPAFGTVSVSDGGGFTYSATSATLTTDRFTYKVTDCNGQSSTATVDVTFQQPVVAKPDTYTYHKSPLTVTVADGLAKNDVAPEACAAVSLEYTITTPPSSGTATPTSGGGFTYTATTTPPATTDQFTYQVKDCRGQVSTATVNLKYEAPADAIDDTKKYSLSNPATELTVTAEDGLLANDKDATNCATQPTVTAFTQPAAGQIVVTSDGGYTYTPTGYPLVPPAKTDTFTYTITDCWGNTDTATVQLVFVATATAVPDTTYQVPTTATSADPFKVISALGPSADGMVGVLANDLPGDCQGKAPPNMKAIVKTPPLVGLLKLNVDGTFEYVPPQQKPPSNTVDTFTYYIEDCNGNRSNDAQVTLKYQ